MDNMRFCQSCGMPMGETDELYGLNSDGSKSKDYCIYCIKDGEFTADVSMNGMIEICIPHMVSAYNGMTEESARHMMQEFFPKLKRWQNK
ncbi:zinc ribbon domain-containing protein [Proteiniborus sp. MB09-C3]|uniref:zinc ribbon domain-containing protein n=1 Tax=Proteiniborus sp. MB09-C3 TaxID=3050072 RepID=UPI0025566F5D|nr:zinc ribbon domain-containing protein [Proteiniborus sp. MB09-C3]WIV12615.1 zinc ribbon domain-containing protein [Proteiniborus sp. MB09-C3]